jgi:hypothetical protein
MEGLIMKSWLDNLTGRLLIVAHTEVQLNVFCRNHCIPKNKVCRITGMDNLRGINVDRPLILLPDWWLSNPQARDIREAIIMWDSRGGDCVNVSEETVLGKAPLCPEDTDGDGDCHLCAKRGGCTWPNLPGPVLRIKEHARSIIRRHDGLFRNLAK